MVSLTLKDIQGNILQGYGFPYASYLFLTIPDPESGRGFLGEIVGGVRDAERWNDRPATTINIAVTYPGLRMLGVADAVLSTLPRAFREPIRERASRELDDTGPSAPGEWDEGLGTGVSHLLVMVHGSEGNEEPFQLAVVSVIEQAKEHGLRVAHQQGAVALPTVASTSAGLTASANPQSREDSARRDQDRACPRATASPGVTSGRARSSSDTPTRTTKRSPVPPRRCSTTGPTWSTGSSTKTSPLFRSELYKEAARYGETVPSEPPLDGDQLYELMAAKVVGRWRDGVAIELVQQRTEAESRKLGGEAQEDPDNDFRYWDLDQGGPRCPKGAHIRRTNPRDALGWGGKMSTRHRIIRRGMPYGEPLSEGRYEDDGQDRGLIFICFNADIERQFETIQAQWCNDGNAFRLGNDKDYLLGDNQGTGKVTIQGAPPYFATAQPGIVLTRGCEYLLMPGIKALRDLAAH